MIKAFASVILTGKNFYPEELLKRLPGIHYRSSHKPRVFSKEIGEILPHGGAIINHPSNLGKPGNEIAWEDMLSFLLEHHQTLRECGVQDIDLTLIFFYQDSGGAGWHIEAEDIQKLAKLGIGLSIDWYQIDDEESYKD